MLRPAQVVTAVDAVAVFVTDVTAQGDGAEDEQPEDRPVEDRVDCKAWPDWCHWQNFITVMNSRASRSSVFRPLASEGKQGPAVNNLCW